MDRFQLQEELTDKLMAATSRPFVGSLIAAATRDWRRFEETLLPMLKAGGGLRSSDPGAIIFPDANATEEGCPEASYGYIEFAPSAFEETVAVPFDEALKLFQIAAAHYALHHPDRRAAIDEGMKEAQNSFERLRAHHEAWKRASSNGVDT